MKRRTGKIDRIGRSRKPDPMMQLHSLAHRGSPLSCKHANCQRGRGPSPRTGKPTLQVWCRLTPVIPSSRERIAGLRMVVRRLTAVAQTGDGLQVLSASFSRRRCRCLGRIHREQQRFFRELSWSRYAALSPNGLCGSVLGPTSLPTELDSIRLSPSVRESCGQHGRPNRLAS